MAIFKKASTQEMSHHLVGSSANFYVKNCFKSRITLWPSHFGRHTLAVTLWPLHFGRHTLAVTLWQSHFSRHISTRDVEVLKNTGSTFQDDTKHIGYQVLKDIAN